MCNSVRAAASSPSLLPSSDVKEEESQPVSLLAQQILEGAAAAGGASGKKKKKSKKKAASLPFMAQLKEEGRALRLTEIDVEQIQRMWRELGVIKTTALSDLICMDGWARIHHLGEKEGLSEGLKEKLTLLKRRIAPLNWLFLSIAMKEQALKSAQGHLVEKACERLPSWDILHTHLSRALHECTLFYRQDLAAQVPSLEAATAPILQKQKRTIASFKAQKKVQEVQEARKMIEEMRSEVEKVLSALHLFQKLVEQKREGRGEPAISLDLCFVEEPPFGRISVSEGVPMVYQQFCFLQDSLAEFHALGFSYLCLQFDTSLFSDTLKEPTTSNILALEERLCDFYGVIVQMRDNSRHCVQKARAGTLTEEEWRVVFGEETEEGSPSAEKRLNTSWITWRLMEVYVLHAGNIFYQMFDKISFQLVSDRFMIDFKAHCLLWHVKESGQGELPLFPQEAVHITSRLTPFTEVWGLSNFFLELQGLVGRYHQAMRDGIRADVAAYYETLTTRETFDFLEWRVAKIKIEAVGLPILQRFEKELIHFYKTKYAALTATLSDKGRLLQEEELDILELLFSWTALGSLAEELNFLVQPRVLSALCQDALRPLHEPLTEEVAPLCFFSRAVDQMFQRFHVKQLYFTHHPLPVKEEEPVLIGVEEKREERAEVLKKEKSPKKVSKREQKRLERDAGLHALQQRQAAHQADEAAAEEEQVPLSAGGGTKLRHILGQLFEMGLRPDHQTGSHLILRSSKGGIVVVPQKEKLPQGTLRSIFRQAAASGVL